MNCSKVQKAPQGRQIVAQVVRPGFTGAFFQSSPPRATHILFIVLIVLSFGVFAEPTPEESEWLDAAAETQRAAEAIREFIGDEMFEPGGLVVLKVAEEGLAEKHAAGEALLVRIEDLWAHAIQEGAVLFNAPEKRWGKTGPEETADMIGQTTIGPWQMTVWNIRDTYGPPYGADPEWTDEEIYIWARDNPKIQAKMIADYIQKSYEDFGVRGPYAIQRYFWLEAYVKGEIGQSADWTKSVLAKPPPGKTYKDLTPEEKADTGFYAKQVLLGMPYTKSGMLFWLVVTGNQEAARETIRTWRDQKKMILEGEDYKFTDEPGGYELSPDDVRQLNSHETIWKQITSLINED